MWFNLKLTGFCLSPTATEVQFITADPRPFWNSGSCSGPIATAGEGDLKTAARSEVHGPRRANSSSRDGFGVG